MDILKQFKPSFEKDGYKVSLEWQIQKANIYKQLTEIIDHDQPTLIFLDELTVLLANIIEQEDGKRQTSHFLHWLRDLRITSKSNIRWIFCSSVGINNFTHSHQISDTVNDLKDYKLRPFDVTTSKAMLMKLSHDEDFQLSSEIQEQIITKLVFCLPYFLQLMFEKIKYFVEVEGVVFNETMVDLAYDSLTKEKHFNTWIERIDGQYGENPQSAFVVLRHICQTKEGTTRDNLKAVLMMSNQDLEVVEKSLSSLIYMLTNDGYLMEENGLYAFRSPLLRDFWFNRFVK